MSNEFKKLASGNIRSAKCRFAYTQNVFTPAAMKNDDGSPQVDKNGRAIKKHQLTAVFPKGTKFDVATEAVDATAIAKFGPDYKKKVTLKKPFLKVEDYPKMGFDPEQYEYFVRLSSSEDRPPDVRRADTSRVGPDQASELYSGRWGFVSFNPYATAHVKGGNRVSFGLGNIQLLDHDEPVGGGARVSADEEFEKVDGIAEAGSTDELFGSDAVDDPMA